MTKTIVITSGKGGVGKTNISVNVAIELAQRNYRTCLFDADLGLANVNILLGIDPEYTLDDYIFGDKSLEEIVLQTKFGIDVIPGSSGIEKTANLDREEIAGLVAAFSQIKGYDYFLIDTSSGISRGVMAFCLAGNETIIVITSEATSLTDAYAVLKVMALNNYAGTVKILVNKRPSIPQARQTYLRFQEVVNRHLDIDIAPAGIILNDPNIETAVTRQEPVLTLFPDTTASQCIKAMVSNLIENNSKEHEGGDFGEFWQRYFEHSLPDISQPGKPADRSTPDTSRQPATLETNDSSPSAISVILPPEVPSKLRSVDPNIDQEHAAEVKKPEAVTQDSTISLLRSDALFEVSNLAGPTQFLAKALELQGRGEMTQELLLDIFLCDPILLVKALKMIRGSNAEPGRTNRVTAKHQLVEELGSEVLMNILCTTAIQKVLCPRIPPGNANPATSFWAHSYQCALLAENIAEATGYPFPEEAFIAGLIHDIGRLAMQTGHPEVYAQFATTFRHDKALLELEQGIFKTTHAEIGAKALRAWNLNSFLVDAVHYHTESEPRIKTAFSLVKIVFLACRLSQFPEDDMETDKLGKSLFGLSASQLQEFVSKANERTRQVADRFHMPLSETMSGNTTEETESRFRQLVMEYSMLRSVLPHTPPGRELSEIIRSVLQAFDILFDFRPALCLMPDRCHSFLTAIEYPHCFGEGTLADIQFSLKWEQSLVVESFISGEMKTAMEGESAGVLSLADHQLLSSLGTEAFVCVPMVAHKMNRGVIVFGIRKTELGKISFWQNRLEQFGVQAAGNIYIPEN
jgi:flagellar biosynthesis protein FlhG